MKTVLHSTNDRALTKTAWLTSNHSFNFNNHHHPERNGFGALVVLNDDIIAPGQGFSTHPHRDMEIITIVLKGSLEHKDSTGGAGTLKAGDVQVMTAGTGVFHSEYNPSSSAPGAFLQIWIAPRKKNLTPHYNQQSVGIPNGLHEIITGHDKKTLMINADATINLGKIARGERLERNLQKGFGSYAFLIAGEAEIAGTKLSSRDAIGVSETTTYTITALTDATLLIINVKMTPK